MWLLWCILIGLGGLAWVWASLLFMVKVMEESDNAAVVIAAILLMFVGMASSAGLAIWGCFAVCTDRRPVVGTVVAKRHTSAYSYMMMIQSGDVLVPIYQEVPEQWMIVVRNSDYERGANVTREEFERVQIGELFPQTQALK